jgi:uncharacterized protein YbcI
MEQAQRSPAVAIANAIVQIHKEGYGKGATRARTHVLEDMIVVQLEDVLTRAEQTLVAGGHADQVRATRQIVQQSQRAQFVTAVEEISGRDVEVFMSQLHFDPDIAVEIFLLEPRAEDAE